MVYRCIWMVLLVLTAAPPAKSASPAAAEPAPDLLAENVDTYNLATERPRFFMAAGVDNELTAEEFAAAVGKDNSFVRTFDRWASLKVFDADRSGKIDWFEADAYRRSFRRALLARYDADNDARLTGEERRAADLALAGGKFSPGPAVPDQRLVDLASPPPSRATAQQTPAKAKRKATDYSRHGTDDDRGSRGKKQEDGLEVKTNSKHQHVPAIRDSHGDGRAGGEKGMTAAQAKPYRKLSPPTP